MARKPTRTSVIVAAVHFTIAMSMAALLIGGGAFTGRNPLLAWLLVLAPIVVIVFSLLDMAPRLRIVGYWSMTLPMLVFAGLGALSGWGMLYMIGVIFLAWGALMEKQG